MRRTAESPALEPLVQVDIDLGGGGALGSEVGNDLALSPDGETLVFVALLPDGSTRLYARRLAELTAVELPGTIGARGPFFSPDGRSVGFWAQGSLKKTLVAGGSPVAIVTASDLQGASWGENDEIIATLDSTGRLFRVPVDGGEPVPVFEPAAGTNARWPQHLPGGAILFTQTRGGTASGVHVVRLGDGTSRELLPSGTYGRYLPSGHLLYVDRGTLLAAPFDVATLTLTGTPARVLDGVVTSPSFGFAQLAVANDGTLVYQRTRGSGLTRMMWLDGSAAPPVPAVAEPGRYLWPRVAPDGRRVAVALLEDSDYDIWMYDLAAGTRSRITSAEGNQGAAVWTPDGRFLVYQSAAEGGIVAVSSGCGGRRRAAARRRRAARAVVVHGRWRATRVPSIERNERLRPVVRAAHEQRRRLAGRRARALLRHQRLRDLSHVLARRPLDRVRLELVRNLGGLRARVPG